MVSCCQYIVHTLSYNQGVTQLLHQFISEIRITESKYDKQWQHINNFKFVNLFFILIGLLMLEYMNLLTVILFTNYVLPFLVCCL